MLQGYGEKSKGAQYLSLCLNRSMDAGERQRLARGPDPRFIVAANEHSPVPPGKPARFLHRDLLPYEGRYVS